MGRRDHEDGYEQMQRIEDPYLADTEAEEVFSHHTRADEDGRNAARRAAASWGAPWVTSDDER